MSENSESMNLHRNLYSANSRSRAGSISQTEHHALVVSAVGVVILLASVFPFLVLERY